MVRIKLSQCLTELRKDQWRLITWYVEDDSSKEKGDQSLCSHLSESSNEHDKVRQIGDILGFKWFDNNVQLCVWPN